MISCDPALITSALKNVIRNAAHYTETGTSVDIAMRVNANQLQILVRYRGPGIPQAMLDRVFDPIVRVGAARDRGSGGYGLGLAIAQRSIALHDGEIVADNYPEGGLQIMIELPLKSAG